MFSFVGWQRKSGGNWRMGAGGNRTGAVTPEASFCQPQPAGKQAAQKKARLRKARRLLIVPFKTKVFVL
jgi:hypothetical protein